MIFLDSASGTKPYPEVILTIVDILNNHWGNASADYSFGYDARSIIDNVTKQVAKDINCNPDEIIWTSGACEANSLAISGAIKANNIGAIYTTRLEHASTIEAMINNSLMLSFFINNTKDGFIDIEDLEYKLSIGCRNNNIKRFVSVSFANSEVGTIQDIKSISKIVHKYNGILHVDATQMYPWKQIDVEELGIDLMSVSGQKLHCVKGVGFLYVKDGIEIKPLINGSQQNKRRGGTYPTHLIAAFGRALEITRQRDASNQVKSIRNKIFKHLSDINDLTFNGPIDNIKRLPNNISITINGVSAEEVIALCDERGIMLAKGSACQSYKTTPSSTLMAIGLSEEQALSTIRITIDEFTTMEEIDEFLVNLKEVIEILRKY